MQNNNSDQNYTQMEAEGGSCSNRCWNFFQIFDIFKFLPVPKGDVVSTKRSLFGSILLITIFVAYVIANFVTFLTNNTPRTNQYMLPLSDGDVIKSPPFAITFAYGEDLNISFYDETYFTFALQQVTVFKDVNVPRNYTNVKLQKCLPDQIKNWLGSVNYTDIFCPGKELYMQGQLYTSNVHMYPRITIQTCKNGTGIMCAPQATIEDTLGKGRVFFFYYKAKEKNYATGEESPEDFSLLYYFLVPSYYNRAELYIRKTNFIIKPTYLTTWNEDRDVILSHIGEKFYMSKTPNPNLLFLLWWRLDQSVQNNEIVYTTIVESISSWGALWSVLFTVFAVYFLRYNKNNFYETNPEWDEFDKELNNIKNIDKRRRKTPPQKGRGVSGSKNMERSGEDSSGGSLPEKAIPANKNQGTINNTALTLEENKNNI